MDDSVRSAADDDPQALQVELRRDGPEHVAIAFHGVLALHTATQLWTTLQRFLAEVQPGSQVQFELSGARRVDGSALAVLAHFRTLLEARDVRTALRGAPPQLEHLIRMYQGELPAPAPKRRRAESSFAEIGAKTLVLFEEAKLAFAFFGQLLVELVRVVRTPRRGNFREVPSIMERAGADALPIVLLINFLVGLVMAFQASVQLKRFGANILVADLIGISMTRELGPLMTAIVACGRTGAAFAAQLGTMQVNEEIDALRVLRLSPMSYLVLPRVLGLLLVLPLLAAFADLVGIFGGLVVAWTRLDLTTAAYVNETKQAVELWDVYSGLFKAGVFAVAIGLIACQQGLAAKGGAEGVGKRTTAAVVVSLFTLIFIDAVFTVTFRMIGL